jgi:hypothetical protein
VVEVKALKSAGWRKREEENMSTTASTTIVTNLKSVSAPTANTLKAGGGGGMDIAGMLALAQTKALELKSCLTLIARLIDAADPNLTTINDVLASLS